MTEHWIEKIYRFNKERGLLDKPFDPSLEYRNLEEELEEFVEAENEHEQVDALADIVVFAFGAMLKLGYRPNSVMYECLKEICSRTGSMGEDGKWQKDPDAKTYKADYSLCRQDS